MKMIYVGSLATQPDRDSNWIAAFKKIGCEVISFSSMTKPSQLNIIGKIYHRLNIGYLNKEIQRELLSIADAEKPDWIHFRLPIEFDRKTIQVLKSQNIFVTQYFNDDPFSKKGPIGLHWKFLHALSAYDAHFVYRAHNIEGYKKLGALYVEHCPPTYDPQRHYLSKDVVSGIKYLADVAFIGHWEDDWRAKCLEDLYIDGNSVIINGGNWDGALKKLKISELSPITPVFGAKYNYIYANVMAGLCFFSKINNDSWTERALEIVAVGGLLVCERTSEAESYFKDREEAFFFSSISELIEVIRKLKADPEGREKVRAAGYARLLRGSSTVDDRALQIYKYVHNKSKFRCKF
jgi:hypothetical protein